MKTVALSALSAALSILAIVLVFVASAKEAEVIGYPGFESMPSSSLEADRSTIHDWSLASTMLGEEFVKLPKKYLSSPIKNGRVSASLNNFVIIPALCGTPVLASAEGFVSETGMPTAWNGGLGGYIKIKHLDINIETIYSHLSLSNVSEGDIVKKGQIIGKVGQSGTSEDGCNLQFGVIGAVNPYNQQIPEGNPR